MMSKIIHTDVLIVGSGLAGLTAARHLSTHNGMSIVLLASSVSEKNNPTRLTFKDTIIEHNLQDAILNDFDTFHLITANNCSTTHHFSGKPLVALDYLKACRIIRFDILSKSDIEIFSNRAVDFNHKPDHLEIFLQDNTRILTKLMVDASGKAHFTLKKLKAQLPTLYSHSYGMTFENSLNHPLDTSFFLGASKEYGSGGGWFYPLSESKASLGIAIVNNSPQFPGKELKENFNKVLKKFYPFSHYLQVAKVIKYEVGTIPIEHVSKIYYDRILIIGDAAGHATPWMCMGVEPALNDGKEVAGITLHAIEANNYSEAFLSRWQKSWEAKNNSAYEEMRQLNPKLWFVEDEVWDFIVQYDLKRLRPQEFLERMRYNAHLMSKFTSIHRWIRFKVKKSIGF
jgi:flavin-dependent dehydrogenase